MFKENAINGIYDFVSFTLTNGQTDYSVKTNQVSMFTNIPTASKIFIWSNFNISFKFNSTSFTAIPLDVGNGESPFEGKDIILATDIFLTNASGSDAAVKILIGV